MNTEGLGEMRSRKKNGEVFFFCICRRKKKGRDKGRDGAREHSDIAMLPSQHVTFPPLGQRLKPNVG